MSVEYAFAVLRLRPLPHNQLRNFSIESSDTVVARCEFILRHLVSHPNNRLGCVEYQIKKFTHQLKLF
jgi:hypothetical protein